MQNKSLAATFSLHCGAQRRAVGGSRGRSDEVLATATLDRLLHRAHVLNIKGRNYRLRDLEDALEA